MSSSLPFSGLEIYAEESHQKTWRWENRCVSEVLDVSKAGIGLRRLGEDVRFSSFEARHPLTRGLTGEESRLFSVQAKSLGGSPSWPAAFPRKSGPVSASRKAWARRPVSRFAAVDRAAREDARIRQVRLTLGELTKCIGGWTSEGRPFFEERFYRTFVVEVTAEEGSRRQSGYEVAAVQSEEDLGACVDEAALAARAARRALAKLGAPPAPLGESVVVIAAQAGGTLIHEAVGHSLEADAILEGGSPHFAGKIGRRVAGEKISVLDDPTRLGHRGAFLFDDEGTPAQKTVLIENGVLRDYLYDRRFAARAGGVSNGHGRRESFAHGPLPRMSNTFIAPGPDDPQKIVDELERGLLVTRLGGGQVNTVTGDFVFEVEEGFWVERGRRKHPVAGVTLLGNGPEVLRTIDRVGWDLGWSVGTCGKDGQNVPVADGLPTLRLPRVVVGGRA